VIASVLLQCCIQPIEPSDPLPPSGPGGTASGTVAITLSTGLWQPLANADIQIDSMHVNADSTGRFVTPFLAGGRHPMSVSHPSIVPIDTSITIAGETAIDFQFIVYGFRGTVYRYALPHEVNHDPFFPEFIRQRVSIATTIILDSCWQQQTMPSFDFGYVLGGTYSIHINGTSEAYDLDTVVTIDHDYQSYLDYAFTLKTIAVQREFLYPTQPTISWTYDYYYREAYAPERRTSDINGEHVWSIIQSTPSLTSIRVVRHDTTHAVTALADTTFVTTDTLSVTLFSNSTDFQIPWYHRLSTRTNLDTVPRFHYFPSDTVKISTQITDTPLRGYAKYLSGIGLIEFQLSLAANHHYFERLNLVSFTP